MRMGDERRGEGGGERGAFDMDELVDLFYLIH